MDLNRANLDAMFRSYKAAWQDGLAAPPEAVTRVLALATRVPSTSASNFYAWMDRFPGFRKWVGERVFNNVASQYKELVNEDWEESLSILRKDLEDDNYGVYTPMVRMMAEAWLQLQAEQIIACLTENRTAFDGTAMFAAARKYGDQTINNYTTNALTAANFNTALALMEAYKGRDGKTLGVMPSLLVVGPAKRAAAEAILSNQLIETGTVGAAIQNANYKRCDLLVTPYLTGTAQYYWFLLDQSHALKPVALQMRKEAVPMMDTDPATLARTGQVDFMADGRLVTGPTFPHLAYGGIAGS